MKIKGFGPTEQKIYELVYPIVTDLGYLVWDVRFEKEGASWYLRILIDSMEKTIGIGDCERVNAPISDMLDEVDPITQSYILEVGSAGIERELTRESHFGACIDSVVRVRSIRPLPNGERDVIATLLDCNREEITLRTGEGEDVVKLPLSSLAYVRLYYNFDEV